MSIQSSTSPGRSASDRPDIVLRRHSGRTEYSGPSGTWEPVELPDITGNSAVTPIGAATAALDIYQLRDAVLSRRWRESRSRCFPEALSRRRAQASDQSTSFKPRPSPTIGWAAAPDPRNSAIA